MDLKKRADADVIKLVDLPFYTEGPAVDNDGNFYCTTLTGKSILKIDANGKVTEWAKSVRPNGQVILPDGDHLVCDTELGFVLRFDPQGKFIENASRKTCAGVPVYIPNDLITDSRGNIYFTDSVRHTGKVCFIGADGQESIFATNLDYPNGLIISADQQYLFIAESYKNRVLKIKITEPGKPADKVEVFAALPSHSSGKEQDNLPDGIGLITNGDIGVAHYGMQAVRIYNSEGQLKQSIDTTLPLTSNLLFTDERTLFVTGGYGEPSPGAVFKIYL